MRMRSVVVVAIAVFAFLGVLSPPVFAQAPAPKVTINGLIDTVTFLGQNYSQADRDFTKNRDQEWESRNRGVFTLWGEIGKAKGALALEFDIGWGHTDVPVNSTTLHGAASVAEITNECGINCDVQGAVEVKWLFTEFELPWMPAPTKVRLGLQSDRWTYKPAVVMFTDAAGVALESTWSPAFKSRFGFFQYNESSVGLNKGRLGNLTNFGRGDSWAIEASAEISPMKGLDIMPLYIYWQHGPVGTQSGSGSFGSHPNVGGLVAVGSPTGSVFNGNTNSLSGCGPASTTTPTPGAAGCTENRHYFGIDARWKAGIAFFNPTFIYMIGERDVVTALDFVKRRQDMRGFLLDLEGGVTLGPLTLPVMAMYSPGNKSDDNIGNRPGSVDDVKYYHNIYVDTAYGSGRISEILAVNSIDYLKRYAPSTSLQPGGIVGYDRYGRFDIGIRPKYALTPSVTLGALVASHWTAEEVDTNSTFTAANGLIPSANERGKRYLGTDLAAYLTYVMLPGVTLDLGAGVFFPGEALERCNTNENAAAATVAFGTLAAPGTCTTGRSDLQNAYWGAARVRYQF